MAERLDLRESRSEQSVILWRCPACGKVEADTGQSARYCGATRACITRCPTQHGHVSELAVMARWEYGPLRRVDDA